MLTDSHFCMQDDKCATIMLQILGTTTQKNSCSGNQAPGISAHLS